MDVYSFTAIIHRRTGYLIVELLEGITAESTPRLGETLDKLINEDNVNIILDFEKCDYICSTGLGVLHYYRSQAVTNKGDLIIARAMPFIKDVILQTLGKGNIEIFDELESAEKSFKISTKDSKCSPTESYKHPTKRIYNPDTDTKIPPAPTPKPTSQTDQHRHLK